MKFKKTITFGEIFLLVSFSFAFAFLFGENVGVVSGQGEELAGALYETTGPNPTSVTAGMPTGAIPKFEYAGTKEVFFDGTLYEGTNVYSWGGADYAVLPEKGLTFWDGTAWQSAPDAAGIQGLNVPPASGTATTATPQAGAAAGIKGILSGNAFGTTQFAGVASSLFSGLAWGAIVGGIAWGLASLFGLSSSQAQSVGLAAGAGTFVGTTAYFMASHYATAQLAAGTPSGFFSAFTPGMFGITLGAITGIAILLLTYKKEKKELVRFECLPWEPPRGGANCELCNENPLMPCSEYRCKSLGQGCELINQGTSEETCVWIHKGDTAAPHMEPWAEALKPAELRYVPDSAISPPNRGFKIVDNTGDECLQPFTNLEFGITTDEPAQCKIDFSPKATYDEMEFLFSDSNLFLQEHTRQIRVPSPFNEQGNVTPELGIDGTYTLWARCIDANGNGEDSAMVAFRYCVDPAPDTTDPTIEGTSITSGSPVQFNVDSVPIEVYTDEPAECKWSRQDKDFDSMENAMDCSTETYQVNANLNYVCAAQLSGITNREDNWFYFRCKDYSTAPSGRNTMKMSYPLVLKGTQELTINSVGPTGEFSGSTSIVQITLTAETAHGAEEGKSVCYFSDVKEDTNSYIAMENTNSFTHNQSLNLAGGSYTYYFRCVDAGANSVEASTEFKVSIDTTVPTIARVLKDGNILKVITNEEAKCSYSETNCNFELIEGIAMNYENPAVRVVHTAEWNEEIVYYIKCEDLRGNQPRPDFCQIIVRASEL